MGTMAKILVTCAFVVAVATVGFGQPGPALTSEQNLRVERLNLLQRIVQLEKENNDLKQQLVAVQVHNERNRLKSEAEQANPGFEWNPDTGKFTQKEPPGGDLR